MYSTIQIYSTPTMCFIDLAVLPRCKNFDDFSEVRLHIMKFDDELCTETFLGNLNTYIASKDDDLKIMKKYQEGPIEACIDLDIPEQFIIEVRENKQKQTFCLQTINIDVQNVSLRKPYSLYACPCPVLGKV